MTPDRATSAEFQGDIDSQTLALRLIATVLIVGALYLMGAFLLPFVLAVILAIALAPVADWLGARGLPRTLANLLCMLFVAAVLAASVGLIVYQAGTIIQDSDKYYQRFSRLLSDVSRSTGGERLMRSLGMIRSVTPAEGPGAVGTPDGRGIVRDREVDPGAGREDRQPGGPAEARSPKGDSAAFWGDFVRRNARSLIGWVTSGLGGIVGFVGGVVVLLAYLFYMLETRREWIRRLTLATARLGLHPRHQRLEQVQTEIVTYLGCLFLVSLGYTVLVTAVLWMIGVPQPLLWGVLAGILEFIPYFGPLIAAVLPTIVALSLGSWWQPLAVVAQYVGLHALESYVVAPLLYGGAVKINPVTVLFGVLFFGWLWGPLGLTVAMPVMLLLRGLLLMTPDTPALDALMATDAREKARDDGA